MVTFIEMFLTWVISLSGLSFCLTRSLASYNLKKLEVTVGQIIPLMCELTVAIWSIVILINYDEAIGSIIHLLSFVIGFYTYDMLHMLTYEEGRKSYLYYVHHIVTIGILGYLVYFPKLAYNIMFPVVFLILEASSASVNATALYKQFIQVHVQWVELANAIIYCITRIIAFPITIFYTSHIYYMDENLTVDIYIFPILVLCMLYVVCCVWFRTMALKHYKKYYTVPPTPTETNIAPTHNLLS
jgi:hypothetical protein